MKIGILSAYKKMQQFFVGRLLEEEEDYYSQAKIRLIYNLSMILILLLIPVAIQLVIQGLYINAGITFVAVFGLMGVVLLLKYHGKVNFAAKYHVVLGLLLLTYSCLSRMEAIAVTNEIWFVIQVLFAFFTLGRAWAIGTAVASAGIMMYYVNFYMYDNLHNELIYQTDKIHALLFIIPIEFFSVYYLINEFLKTRDYAERQLKQTNEELRNRNSIIEKQKDEKSAMIKEIHHRVKNNLQIVNSLLRLQSNEITDKKALQMLEESQNRVLSMALLHENLYKIEEELNVADHLNMLASDLLKAYSLEKNIELDLVVNVKRIGTRTMVPLGLIINETISNSLKYAFPDHAKGRIILYLLQLDNNRYELIIGDDGIGMDATNNNSSLGLELVQLFTDQLEGTTERLPGPGSLSRITFKGIG